MTLTYDTDLTGPAAVATLHALVAEYHRRAVEAHANTGRRFVASAAHARKTLVARRTPTGKAQRELAILASEWNQSVHMLKHAQDAVIWLATATADIMVAPAEARWLVRSRLEDGGFTAVEYQRQSLVVASEAQVVAGVTSTEDPR